MRIKLVTLQFAPSLGGFDDRPLADFVRDKEVLAVREHFFVVHEQPHLACLVTYQDPGAIRSMQAPESTRPTARRESRDAPRIEVAPENLVLYETLREWRSSRARKDGVPPYVIANNRELATIANTRPTTVSALAAIPGIGPGKVERYGARLLALVNGECTSEPATT